MNIFRIMIAHLAVLACAHNSLAQARALTDPDGEDTEPTVGEIMIVVSVLSSLTFLICVMCLCLRAKCSAKKSCKNLSKVCKNSFCRKA